MARNIADISGTSNSSPQSCSPTNASCRISAPVAATTTPSVRYVAVTRQTRNPYTSVRLIQMKWNGIVSQLGHRPMATRFAAAKVPQAASIGLRRSKAIARMADRLDRRVGAQLLAEPADADVDDVRPWIEVVAPDLGQEPLAADHLARMLHQLMQDTELAVGQLRDDRADVSLVPRQIERHRPRPDDVAVVSRPGLSQLDADTCDQLVEGKRLAEVVGCAEPEAAQLRRQIRASRDDHDRELGTRAVQLVQDAQPVEAGQEQVQQHEVVAVAARAFQPLAAVPGGVHGEPFGLEPSREEAEDPRFVLDHQDAHASANDHKRDDAKMTRG